jgi:hypothetical protein
LSGGRRMASCNAGRAIPLSSDSRRRSVRPPQLRGTIAALVGTKGDPAVDNLPSSQPESALFISVRNRRRDWAALGLNAAAALSVVAIFVISVWASIVLVQA